MSIDLSGIGAPVRPSVVAIDVAATHPLIRLAAAMPWSDFAAIATADLKTTTAKGSWWTGRKIQVRTHLGAYFLQKLYDYTDRQIEYAIKDNAAARLFCGFGIVDNWHAPDHTKVESFRSRLSSETQRRFANELAKIAVTFGFADASQVDFDSTVQEANISYPADASLMSKLCGLGKKVVEYCHSNIRGLLPAKISINMKRIRELARGYFFLAKNTTMEKRREAFTKFHQLVKRELKPIVEGCERLRAGQFASLPWNIRRAVGQINSFAWRYLLDVAHFIRTHRMKRGKILSFHSQAAVCIKKGKVGKDKEFGRVYQLGRIKGNFLFVLASTTLRMADKHFLVPLASEHASIFGDGMLKSVATDKGYSSGKNYRELKTRGVAEIGIQRPSNLKSLDGQLSAELTSKLRDRRAGIEPLIGHAKHGGQLGRSRMKSDTATLAAGYASVTGLNLRQLIRHQGGKMKKAG